MSLSSGHAAATRRASRAHRLRSPLVPAGAVLALTAVAFGLRVSQVHQALFADELFTYDDLHGRSFESVLRTVQTGGENSPPLFFLLAWMSAKLGDTAVWIRLPSLLLGTATVPLVYALGRETLGRTAGLIGAAVVALSPFAVLYGVDARPYATMIFFVVLSTMALLRAVTTGSRWWWLLYVVSAAAAAYSHYTSIFALGVQAIWSLWMCRDRLRAPLIANAVVVLLFVPWLPYLRGKQLDVIGSLHPLGFSTVLQDVSKFVVGYPGAPLRKIPTTLGLFVVGTCAMIGLVVCVARGWRSPSRARRLECVSRPALIGALAVATPIGLLVYSLVVTDLFAPRALLASLPAAAIALGALLATLPRPATVITAAAVSVVLLAGTLRSFGDAYRRDPINDIARFVDARAGRDAVVVYIPVTGLVLGNVRPFSDDLRIYLHRHVAFESLPSQQQLANLWRSYRVAFVVAPRNAAAPEPPPQQRRSRLATAEFRGIHTYVVAEYGPASRSAIMLAPVVTSVHPPDGTIGFPANSKPYAVFNEPMDHVSTTQAFSLRRATDNRVVPGRAVMVGDLVSVFIPSGPLAAGTKYIATIASAAMDAFSRTHLATTRAWRFTAR